MDEVYMDIPAVRNTAGTLGTIGDVLRAVARALQVLVQTLRATAFVGLVGGFALAQTIDTVRPHIERVSEKCLELQRDVNASVDAYERGDAQGATRFF
jgi:hypothetical protein